MGRRTSKPFSSLWNDSWNEKVDMGITDKDILTELEFDQKNNKLLFVIKHYHREPKITRYVTSNYVRTPIYGGYSERTRIVKKFNKTINPLRFVNEEILQLNMDKNFMLEIIEEIGLIPEWRKKEIILENIGNELKLTRSLFRGYSKEKKMYNFKTTDFQEISGNFWLRFFLGFITFFLSFLGYVSKKHAALNKKRNIRNKKWNDEHKVKIDEKNAIIYQEIEEYNKILQKKIDILTAKYNEESHKEIKYEKVDKEGWVDLRHASNFLYSNLNNKKGIYIIWNKSKNKHYIGQSKNIGKRMVQHFKNGEVKNIIFAQDWYSGDNFMYKYHFCETKDELDSLEKRYIEEYNSFERGYNSTNGNL